jgi:predicted Kef-type K+ transport protein
MRWLIAQLVWVTLAALIILIDARDVKARAHPDNTDLTNRSVGQYLPFMALFGGFLIPFYLWNSRKTGGAVLAGLVLMVACGVVVGLVVSA